ncbi:MAG: ATP-binding protein [Pseudooceanicola sp.]|nr:ATP-binding protein [Pseudooceanicola sp.]
MTPDDLRQHLAQLQMTFGIAMPEAPVPLPDIALITEATDRAALSGAFDLHRLTRFVHPDDRAPVRQTLAEASTPVAASRLRWLDPDRRRAALSTLLANPAGLPALLSRLRLRRDDAPGQTLRRLLRGWRPDLARLSEPRLAALITALGWLDGLPAPTGPALPDARAARLELTRRERQRNRDAVLTNGFVGRQDALDALKEHTRDPAHTGRVLIFTGPGGIGKSALLARATAELGPSVPVFTFDFDQPALDPRGPGLTLDLTRQLALLVPREAGELSQIRTLLRDTWRESGGETGQTGEASLRATSEAGTRIAQVVHDNGLYARPVLLVFDTLEVLAAQGPQALDTLNEWMNFARYNLGMSELRAVMAGRAAEDAAPHFPQSITWTVPPLDAPDAQQLLVNMGLDLPRADAAAPLLGGNPLVLRLGGRYLIDHPDAPAEDLAEGGPADAAMTQGLLYRRILNHVGAAADDPLRRIAYPGLALRLITPAILRHVIAPALEMDPDATAALWDRLTRQTWLVERETDTRFRHRRDLRTEMMRLLRRDEATAPLVARLHERALAHHRRADDPDVPADRARLEAAYHAFMLLEPGEEPENTDAASLNAALAGDIDDLPLHAAATARALTGVPPRPGDARLVPPTWRDSVTARLAWAALDAERPVEALALDNGDTPWCWRLTALLTSVDWHGPLAEATLARLSPLSDDGAPRWWAEHHRLWTDPRFAPIAPRETQAMAEAAAAWLRLFRGEREFVPGWSTGARPSDPPSRIAMMREAVAEALALMQQGRTQDWRYVQPIIRPGVLTGQGVDPTADDESARIALLTWFTGRLGRSDGQPHDLSTELGRAMDRQEREQGPPDPRIPLRPAMIVATPARIERMRGLVPGHKQALAGLADIAEMVTQDATVADLTGTIARDIAGTLTLGNGGRIDRLSRAGYTPAELIHGLMHEYRPPARILLRAFVRDEGARVCLSELLPSLLFLADGPFLPADLQPSEWARGAGQGDGTRAIAALVDWAGRIGRLGEVFDAAASLADDSALAARLRHLAQATRITDRALGGAALA